MTYLQQYAIAAGWNVAQNSLVNTDLVFGLGGLLSAQVKARGLFLEGEEKTDGLGRMYFEGYNACTWLLDVTIYPTLDSLRSTYCNGGWDGLVTIYTTLGGETYYRRNAIMKLPQPSNSDGRFFAIKDHAILMTRLTVPT